METQNISQKLPLCVHLVCPLVSPSMSAAFDPVGLNSGISLKMYGWIFTTWNVVEEDVLCWSFGKVSGCGAEVVFLAPPLL